MKRSAREEETVVGLHSSQHLQMMMIMMMMIKRIIIMVMLMKIVELPPSQHLV